MRGALKYTLLQGGGVAGSLSALKGAVLRGESANVAIVGDSTADATTEWVYGFAAYVASLNSALTVTYRTYNDAGSSWNAPTTIQTGSGAETIAFWNASIASTKPTYLLGAKRAASIDGMPATIALGIINHGLNLVGYSFDHTRRAHLMMLLEAMKLKWATAPTLIVNENPFRDDSNMAAIITAWLAVEALYPDCSVLNAYDAFVAAGKPAAYYDDNTHPSAPYSTAGKGQKVVYDLMTTAFSRAGSSVITPSPAFLSLSASNLLSNGSMTWAGATLTSWAVGGSATVTKDTVVVDPLYGTDSARVEGTAANGYIQQQVGAQALADCIAAGVCSLAARVRTDALGATGVGRIGIITSPSFVTSSIEVNVVPDGAFCWVIAPNLPVPSDATGLFVRLFCDTSANTASKAYYSRAVLVAGSTPRNF